ncbi:unnamed protein product [Hydatigera taeniaeformis]|uniref:MFS domain-containing protein n=1 Tax=Hydatigena taeniaeformis TaxID=6205 RepID=A0A0R3WNR4_HYDTA|nr:unnamed protein product [Hydatigera taeniaeformis]
MTLCFTYAPVPSYLTSIALEGSDVDVLIFSTTTGRVFAAICFFLGITDGAFMTLLGPMLEYYLDEIHFPAGLGISLCIIGAFNLVGTLIGGHLLDASETYHSANLLAACLPLKKQIRGLRRKLAIESPVMPNMLAYTQLYHQLHQGYTF